MDFIQKAIRRYKDIRCTRWLNSTYEACYGFVGIGKHSIENLFPVLSYLQVNPKWICCRSEEKARLIAEKFKHTKGTVNIDDVIRDENVKGVFIAASPKANYLIANKMLNTGKSVFVEKPPCYSMQELEHLIEAEAKNHCMTMVGMQKRYAPTTCILKRHLKKGTVFSYHFRYLTGAYPEGNPLYDLFIHPIDLVCFLFGKAEVVACEKMERKGVVTFFVILNHGNSTGTMELSTAYSWNDAVECLSVNTTDGVYELHQMESLTYSPKRGSMFGIPLDKVFNKNTRILQLFSRDNFAPIMANNQIVTQGYYDEIKTFLDLVERKTDKSLSTLQSMRDTYAVLETLQNK